MKCSNCGSRDIDFQEAGGQSICINCGAVLEENTIVSSIEFQETGDRSHVIGQYVAANCTKPYSSGSRMMGRHMDLRDARDTTLINARRSISQVASTLRLPPLYIERAFRLYQLALQRNFVFGRRQIHVVATCLYIICRQEKSPHLLIDFSDALQINVYVLGKAFLQFTRVLNIALPVVDPSLYIHRYASKLDFSDKTNSVVTTSLRIVTRMKKDWIAIGRRPDSICASALLISARAYGFDVGQDSMSQLFRISQLTLRKRLLEFKNTPAAQLNLQQFFANEISLEFDPPSFINNILSSNNNNETLDINLYDEPDSPQDINPSELVNDDVFSRLPAENADDDDEDSASRTIDHLSGSKQKSMKVNSSIQIMVPLPSKTTQKRNSLGLQNKHKEKVALYDEIYNELFESSQDSVNKEALAKEAEDVGNNPKSVGGWGRIKNSGRIKESKRIIKFSIGKKPENDENENIEPQPSALDEIDIDPLQEAEISTYLFNEEEKQVRTVLWDKNFGEFMEERARRKREREKASEGQYSDKYTQSGKLRKKYTKKISASNGANSDSAGSAVQASSKKINYEALKGVFGGDGTFAVPEPKTISKIVAPNLRNNTTTTSSSQPVNQQNSQESSSKTNEKNDPQKVPVEEFEDEDDEMLLYDDAGGDQDYDYDDEYY